MTQFDLHVSYRRQLVAACSRSRRTRDVFNVLNQQAVTGVDEEYTTIEVGPIENGTVGRPGQPEDRRRHAADRSTRTTEAPTSYQQPLSMRFGLRLSF